MFKRSLFLLFICIVSVIGFASIVSSAATAAEQAAPQAPFDTPQPVLTFFQDISEWQLTSGFIYLTESCDDVLPPDSAYIRRRATNGTTISLLESVNSRPACRTFRHAAVDSSGIYYYNRNLGRIEAIYSDNPTAPPTTIATIGDKSPIGFGAGNSMSDLRLAGAYIYWIEQTLNGEFNPDDVSIKRVAKMGGTPATLLTYTSLAAKGVWANGLGITSTYVWWTDGDGLNRISTCLIQQCLPGSNNKVTEFSISSGEGHIQVSNSSVYWWNGDDNPQRIRRTSCSFLGNNCSTSTIHSTSSGTTIIGVAANTDTIFWTENISQVGPRLRRKALSNGTAETIVDTVYYAAPYVDVDGVYFQEDLRHISRLPFDAAAITREIGISGWEITQGIQRLANDVPLVAGKETYVRVYPTLEDGTDVGAVTAVLHGRRDGSALPDSPIYPINIAIPVTSGLSLADRLDIDSGWLFRLPEAWTRSGEGLIPQTDIALDLRAVIDPNGVYAGADDPNNNQIADEFVFTAKAPTCMVMRPVITHESYQPVYGYNVSQVLELTEALLPTPELITFPKNDPLREIDWCWKGIVYGPFCSTPYELRDDDSLLLTKMGWLDYWAGSPTICRENNARTLYAGIIHKDADWDWAGLARTGKDQFLTKIPKYGDNINRSSGLAMTMVHEIGHNYNRQHVDCNDPLRPDPNYPYPTGMIDFNFAPESISLHYGFDPLEQEAISPLTTADYMSYCDPSWISDYTWKALFNNTDNPFDRLSFSPDIDAEDDLVRIAGVIDPVTNQGTLDYAWSLPAAEADTQLLQKWAADLAPAWDSRSSIADYHLQLIGTEGQVLIDQAIELTGVEDGDEQEPEPYQLTFLAPAGTVDRLQLMDGETVLAIRIPGVNQPALTLNQPISGASVDDEITISWTATDPDDDQLMYTIQYSADGGEVWSPLLVNYGGTGSSNETLTLDLTAEPGSDGATALIRILASDGYNTAVATSDPFTVAKRAPLVAIASPAEGETFAADAVIPLSGAATDPEDGLIANDQFAWSTGQTGTTAELIGQAPGDYTLQLTATDSDGQQGTSELPFTVAPLTVPETAASFVLDGRCDDAGYQTATQLPLTPYGDGSRASARVIHTSSKLWLCLTGLQETNGYVGMLVDNDHSADATVQNTDYGYFVQQDGTSFVNVGNGTAFGYTTSNALSARIYDHGTVWSAELQIDDSAFGSWQKRVGIALGHFEQTGDVATTWPNSALLTSPQSWGQTNLGLMAALTAVAPESAVWGTGDITLTVMGENFTNDHLVLWDSNPVSTTLVSADTLTATVPANLVTAAGVYDVAVGNINDEGLTTAAYPFTVNNPQPIITSINPGTAQTGSTDTLIAISGSGFVAGAIAVWDGEIYPTIVDSSTQLIITVTAGDLTTVRSVPITVSNPEPSVGPSNTFLFTVTPSFELLFLPIIN